MSGDHVHNQSENPTTAGSPKIAVIAVHGVANQQPGETVRAIASALQAESAAAEYVVDGFVEQDLSIPITKVHLNPPMQMRQVAAKEELSLPKQLVDRFDERPEYIRWLQESSHDRGEAPRIHHAGVEFMDDQVRHYDPQDPDTPDRDNSIYETLCLSGLRRPSHQPDAPGQPIDVYELYWADLSRLQNSWLAVLSGFYQLIFHVCSLGRNTLDFAQPELKKSSRWYPFILIKCHALATLLLTVVAPILNLCLIAVLLIVFPAKIPDEYQRVAAIAGALVLVVAACAVGMYLRNADRRRWRGVWYSLSTAFLLAASFHTLDHSVRKMLVVEWGFVAAAGFVFALAYLNERKRQASIVGSILGVLTVVISFWQLLIAEDEFVGLARAAIQIAAMILMILTSTWVILGCAVAVVALFTCWEWLWRFRCGGKGTQIDRALATGFISLILPSTLFVIVTLNIYTPLFALAQTGPLKLPQAPFEITMFGHRLPYPENIQTIDKAASWMIGASLTPLYGVILAIWLLTFGILGFGYFWSVWAEIVRPPRQDLEQSKFVGEALNTAYGSLRFAFLLMFIGFPVLFFTASAFGDRFENIGVSTLPIAIGMGTVAISLYATGNLGNVVRLVWPALDVILDVDNYLRMNPLTGNPKARIAARYVSLLRYLAKQHYTKIVIVAHSQGTVITADLLRFLRDHPDPQIVGLPFPVQYLTMGSPLRQLYGWRFPRLYDWAHHEGPADPAKIEQGTGAATAFGAGAIHGTCWPDPADLMIAQWINAYCSGDYVGRNLWRDDDLSHPAYNSDVLFQPWDKKVQNESRDQTSDGNYTRRELCFGTGAHTHYFTDNADGIAQLIHDLIGP